MSLPYQSATSGKRALDEIRKILRVFGCGKFATGEDFETGEVFIQFEHRNRMINISVSAKGYAAAWLNENPWSYRRQATKGEWEQKALKIGSVAVYSILRDWVKAQTTMIEAGVMEFEAAFLSHIMLPSGKSVIDELEERNILKLDKPNAA